MLSTRRIIHLDLDAFFASVEQLDDPTLRGRAVIVGGGEHRGVVCACSYEARRFGVRSAMAMARALQLCPEAVVRPVRMARYRKLSGEVFEIYRRYTDLVEPLSIDEAFLDVTASHRLFGSAVQIAERIRDEVLRETGLRVSAGVAGNKFVAKLASDRAKPDGLLVVEDGDLDGFLLSLPVSALWGVGKSTEQQLLRMGIQTLAQLRAMDPAVLCRRLGNAGVHLLALARGQDDRPVVVSEPPKSLGAEQTFERDLLALGELEAALLALSERLSRRARDEGIQGHCLTLKVKYADFQSLTRSRTLGQPLDSCGDIYRTGRELLKNTEAGSRPVRLLGLALSGFGDPLQGQTLLFPDQARDRRRAVDAAVDSIRRRFGEKGVLPATLMGSDHPGSEPEH